MYRLQSNKNLIQPLKYDEVEASNKKLVANDRWGPRILYIEMQG